MFTIKDNACYESLLDKLHNLNWKQYLKIRLNNHDDSFISMNLNN